MTTRVVANHILFDAVREAIERGDNATIPTKGLSMLPFIIGERDSVTLSASKEYIVGDIVLAEVTKGQFVLHRIIAISDSAVTLMGDGNIRGVERVRLCDIIAKAIMIHHKGQDIDCNTPKQKHRAKVWRQFLPVRRYILAIYTRVIGVRKW